MLSDVTSRKMKPAAKPVKLSHSLAGRLLGCALLLPAVAIGADVHPIETQLKSSFPSLSLDSSATFEAAETVVNGRIISGLRARFSAATEESSPQASIRSPQASDWPAGAVDPAPESLSVQYPRLYDDAIVVKLGMQRVVLRPVGASSALATAAEGKLVYDRPYPFTDAIEVPGNGRSEELLLLQDRRAPRVYEYEIVESEGISGAILDGGAVRFLPKSLPIPSVAGMAAGLVSRVPESLQIDRPWIVDSSGQRFESKAEWQLVGHEALPRAIRLTLNSELLSYPLVVDPSFSATGSLATSRSLHTATLLPNGKVLIAGGSNYDFAGVAPAEIYNPAAGTFGPTGSMVIARREHTATLLPNGKVLIAGGFLNGPGTQDAAELYDPDTGTFRETGHLVTARTGHTATLLPNGKVLIVGGFSNASTLASAELYDPAAGTFSPTGSLLKARYYHTATLLPNGKVLIAGGTPGYLPECELYDPASGSFSATGSLATDRYHHTATPLPGGKVLMAGGRNISGAQDSAELYDPATGKFIPTGSLVTGRSEHLATLLPNGKVLVVAGRRGTYLASAELYDPASGSFSATSSLATGRSLHTATLLPSGRVLVAGGENDTVYFASTEVYDTPVPRRRAVRR